MTSPDLRLIVITDRALAGSRSIIDIVAAAVAAGAPAVQLRDKTASARDLFDLTNRLLPIVAKHGALLFINDRIDVALAAGAHGAHLGPGDMPLTAARSIAPPPFLLGFSTDDPVTAREAERAGADYIGCGAVFGTTTKIEVGDERIGTARLDTVARAVSIPVVGIGGINASNIGFVADTACAGAAVVGAVMTAPDPGLATRILLEPFTRKRPTRR